MSTPTLTRNVIVCTTDGDTLSQALNIVGVKLLAGSDTATATLKIGSQLVWSSGNVTTNTAIGTDQVYIRLTNSETLTINLTGTAPKLYIYTR